MSPATAEAVAPVSLGPGFFHEAMPLEQLRPSPLNPRKHFDQVKIDELAQSIREIGLIEPLVARPVGDHYEIVAGERRFHAATRAGLDTVSCTVKPLSEAQALEIMVVENNQREDVNALEEADGFSRLLKSGYKLDRLAERLGRSTKYVYDRIKLLDLATPAKQLLAAGTISAGHGILLARLKPADQLRALDVEHGGVFESEDGLTDEEQEAADAAEESRADREDRASSRRAKIAAAEDVEFSVRDVVGVKPKSVRETAHWIAAHVRFRPQEAAAAAPLEFGEVAARVDQALLKPGRGKKVIAITFEHYIQPEAREESERTFGPRSFKFADGKPHREYGNYGAKPMPTKTCEHSVLGVVAVGEKYGQAFEVCIARDKCQVHWKSQIADRAKNQKLRESGHTAKAERREERTQERESADRKRRELEEKIGAETGRRVIDRVVAGVTEPTPDLLRLVLKELLGYECQIGEFNRRFGIKWSWNGNVSLLKALSGRTLAQALAFAVADNIASVDGLESVAKAFKVDASVIEAAVRRELAPAAVQTSAQKKKPAKKKR